MEKVIRIGKIMLIFTLILALTSCSSGVVVSKTNAKPSKESIDILIEAGALITALKYKEARKLLEDKYDIIKDNDLGLDNYGIIESHIFKNYEMAGLYATLVLYDEAAIEYKKALAHDTANEGIKNKLHEMELYLSFREELYALLDEYYRGRCINGMREEMDFYKRIKPAYEKIAVLFPHIKNNSGGSALSTNILNEEIEKKFSVRIANIKANGSMLGAHFRRIIDSSVIHSALWGEEIDLKVITLKNMASNGLDYWRFMGSAGVGGWSISQTEIIKVILDNEYDNALRAASFYNEGAKEDFIKEYGGIQVVEEEREPLQIYFSPDISFQFIDKQMDSEVEKAKSKGISDNELQSCLFERLEKDFNVKSNIIHESQHSIDNKTGVNLKWLGEAEYSVKFPQIDVIRNILAQLTKLSDDDLKGIAIDVFQKYYPDEKYH